MKNILRFLITCAAALSCHFARGAVNVPYAPDANTMHLWHFDTMASTNGLNIESDAVLNNPITLTNYGLPTNTPPFTNIYVTNFSAISALGGSLFIATNSGVSGGTQAMAAGPQDMAATNFFNTTSGAFTFEAIVNIGANIYNSANGLGEWEILCGDNSVGTRGWQFRLQNAAAPQIDFNFITAAGGTGFNWFTNLPTTGPDALVVGSWYHVAVTYTGNAPTNSDTPGLMSFYWTLFDPTRTNADLLATTNINAAATAGQLGGTPSPAVGGSQRTTHGVGNDGAFQGQIDEVRVSCIARQAYDMAFNSSTARVPYTPDFYTMHLWHLDTMSSVNGYNTEIDAVVNNPITLTNYGLPTNTPPFTNLYVTNYSAVPTLGSSLFIATNSGVSGGTQAMAAGPQDMAATNFFNTTSGAFTFEAIVNIGANIYNSANGLGEWEILCGDNSVGTRGWQFRLQNAAAPQIDFNFITATGGTGFNWFTNLPTTGPDALVVGSWYHVAVTYTGNAPTNSDTPGLMSFYWTLFDPTRTNADLLATTNINAAATAGQLGGTPSPAIGGSQRTTHGVGNDGAFQGGVDEVRVSAIARQPNDMAFSSTVSQTAPVVTHNSPANTFIGFGQTLSLNPVITGTSLSFQWQEKNSLGVWTNLPTQTGNALTIPNITFAANGSYWLIASNSIASATTTVASVTVGAIPGELYNTGYNTNGFLDTTLAGLPDPHYTVIQSADIGHLGPQALVWNMGIYPIAANGGEFANIDGTGQWIGTQEDSYASPAGVYTYHTTFLMDGVDPTQPMTLSGTIWVNSGVNGILLNGVSTGNQAQNADPNLAAPFTISSGFVPGLNTLDFVVTNAGTGSYQESAIRVEMMAIGQPLPAGKPSILQNPAPVTVSDFALSGVADSAGFSVVATGRPPLTYQWLGNGGAAINGATNRTLTFLDPAAGNQPTSFQCIISNTSGAVTSTVASLTLVSTNIPVVFPVGNYVAYSNQNLTINLSTLVQKAINPDGLQLYYDAVDGFGTNGLSMIALTGDIITYTPAPGAIGTDSFTYTLLDSIGNNYTGTNIVKVVLPLRPTFSGLSLASSSGLVMSGSGGAAGGPYYVLTSTSVTNSLTNWTVLSSNLFNASGNFLITNPVTPGAAQQYFTIQVP